MFGLGLFETDDPFEDLDELDWENLEEEDYDLKFFVWSRKIDEMIKWYEDRNFSDETIRIYLEKCAWLRKKFLDFEDLTEIEESYMEKIQPIWEKYQITDPIFRN